jgi:hypothetical protein
MRVFWWQGGLDAEPENDVETEALLVLLDGLKVGRSEHEAHSRPGDGSGDERDLRDQLGGLDVGQ